jgi:poly(hydroxyalkanoate) depolymerase family esterase
MARLAAKRAWAPALPRAAGASRLKPLTGFGTNPGKLAAWTHMPESMEPGAPLVVVLHGCTQTADAYDHGSGWTKLADELGFAVLFPEQQGANNPNRCFNWFDPAKVARGSGEALSIMQMVDAVLVSAALSPDHVHITGLSAGGAMAAAMLAAYPERFTAGAIIAGLPSGSANSVPQAFQRMRGQGQPAPADLAASVRAASDHDGPWPVLSVWHGAADATVHPSNADAIVAQWALLHGLDASAPRKARIAGHDQNVWAGPDGRPVIASYRMAGLGHGTPIKAAGPDSAGVPGPFMLEAGLSSTREIARSWGLFDAKPAGKALKPAVIRGARAKAAPARQARAAATPVESLEKAAIGQERGQKRVQERVQERVVELPAPPRPKRMRAGQPPLPPHAGGILGTIENALRAAGLMR